MREKIAYPGPPTDQQTAAQFAERPMGELGDFRWEKDEQKGYLLCVAGAALAARDVVVVDPATWTATLTTTQAHAKAAGICAAAVASGTYFWLQVRGVATGRKGSTGSTDIADNDLVVTSATAGGGALDGNLNANVISNRNVGVALAAQAVTAGNVTLMLNGGPLGL